MPVASAFENLRGVLMETALTAATAFVARTGEPLPKRSAAAPALLPEAKARLLTHCMTFLPEIISSTPTESLLGSPQPSQGHGQDVATGSVADTGLHRPKNSDRSPVRHDFYADKRQYDHGSCIRAHSARRPMTWGSWSFESLTAPAAGQHHRRGHCPTAR
jgi:hypothetical protein